MDFGLHTAACLINLEFYVKEGQVTATPHEGVLGSGGRAPRIRDLGTSRR